MNLTDYRKKKKLTQGSFGELLDPPVSQALVSQWELGETRITLDYAVQINRKTKGAVKPEDCNSMYKGRDSAAS